jgi:hypothetical protein
MNPNEYYSREEKEVMRQQLEDSEPAAKERGWTPGPDSHEIFVEAMEYQSKDFPQQREITCPRCGSGVKDIGNRDEITIDWAAECSCGWWRNISIPI